MLYFIPAWYQPGTWSENEQKWYVRREHTEFDDTVKQIQLFHRSKVYPYKIMLLSYTPNLRHFLHRQSVYHAPYWSCFDAIQEVRRKKAMVLSVHNLSWPEQIEFIYTPFVLVAMLQGEKYAQVEFGEDGNPIQIDLYQQGALWRRNIYDDRGFVSASVVYEQGKMLYQDYLTEKGTWKIRCFGEDGHVEINPRCATYLLQIGELEEQREFQRSRYDRIEDVIEEVYSAYSAMTDEADIFCIAMKDQHADLLQRTLKGRTKILSFFEDRVAITKWTQIPEIVAEADYLIADSGENRKLLRDKTEGSSLRIKNITPFDSREDFGISQQLNVQKILVPVDGMEEEKFAWTIPELGKYLQQNENARIILFTREASYHRKEFLLEQTRKYLRLAGMKEEWAGEAENNTAENTIDVEKRVPVLFYVEQCVDELAVSKCIREQRLVVDLRSTSEVYLRVAALSTGIPQLIATGTQFVEDGKNGRIVKQPEELVEDIHFYLDSLANWNDAMIASYELGKRFSTEVLIEEWKEVIDSVRRDSRITNGR